MPEGAENPQVIDNNTQVVAQEEVAINPEQQEIHRSMAFAFDEQIQDVSQNTNVDNQQADENGAAGVVATETQAPSFEFKTFTEKFGWEKPEDALSEIESLRQLKDNPPQAEIKYENEQSRQLHQLFAAGKIKEAMQVIDTQDKIESFVESEVTSDNAGDIIKLNMQLKYQDAGLTPKEIDYKYNKQYALPKEPILDTDDEDSIAEHNEWKERVEDIQMGKIIDAKAAKIELQSAKTKLVLPDIGTTNDPEYESFKASTAKIDEAYEKIVVPAINSLKETDVPLSFKVEDANNQMNFDVVLVPTKDDFDKARQDSLSIPEFLSKTCYDKDGNFLPKSVQRMVLLAQNFDTYAQSIARQAVNAERARIIAKETGNNSTMSKDFNVNTEKTEFQKSMEFAFS